MRIPPSARVALAALWTAGLAGCQEDVSTSVRYRAPESPATSTPAPDYDLRPAERSALGTFLQRHPDLRPARDSDRRGEADGFDRLYGVYHPYFVRGDVNDDGMLDFVLGFVRRERAEENRFSVVVFLGLRDGGFQGDEFLERDVELADGDVAVDRDAVLVTPDLAGEEQRRYRWDLRRRRFVSVRDPVPEEQEALSTKSI